MKRKRSLVGRFINHVIKLFATGVLSICVLYMAFAFEFNFSAMVKKQHYFDQNANKFWGQIGKFGKNVYGVYKFVK